MKPGTPYILAKVSSFQVDKLHLNNSFKIYLRQKLKPKTRM